MRSLQAVLCCKLSLLEMCMYVWSVGLWISGVREKTGSNGLLNGVN